MSKKSKDKRQQQRERMFSSLQAHRRQGKQLITRLASMDRLALSSWLHSRLPEMLWAVLLVGNAPREHALAMFRESAATLKSQREGHGPLDVTLSGIATMSESVANEFLEALTRHPAARDILSGLLLFKSLPGRERWVRAVRSDTPRVGWDAVAHGVAACLNHQSQEATDVRWARLVSRIVAGRALFAPGMQGHVEQLLRYPDVGDMRDVRGSIRAGEGAMAAAAQVLGDSPSRWVDEFWGECMASTPCDPMNDQYSGVPSAGATVAQVEEVRTAVERHLSATRTTTGLDARHDAAFGMVLYALGVLSELMRIGNATSVLGRAGLRTILESFLTLAYLAKVDDPEIWMTYRRYGAGQAKLAFLKLDVTGAAPSSVTTETLEALANEDLWQEFVPIDLGQWMGSDLRKMSDAAGQKAHYDKHYSWTSGFVHGNWAAVRSAVFTTCMNPLHRLHRIPRKGGAVLDDVVPDAVELCNAMLETLGSVYPPFSEKIASR